MRLGECGCPGNMGCGRSPRNSSRDSGKTQEGRRRKRSNPEVVQGDEEGVIVP